MPMIIVQGRQVPVSDSFFQLSSDEQEAAENQIADQMAWETTTGAPRMTFGQPKPDQSWSELPGNIAPSAVNAATGLWDMVTHPQRTAETLVDAAQGGVDRIMPEEFTRLMDSYVSPRTPETRERQRRVSGAMAQALYDRYGTWRNIKNTMITDPVGSALDVAGSAAGAMGAIRGPLAVSSRARLVESPPATLAAGHPPAKQLGQALADDAIATPVIGKAGSTPAVDDVKQYASFGPQPPFEIGTLDGKRNRIYAPPTKAQRPFEADYPDGVKAGDIDREGNLLVDRNNRPFNPGDQIYGRRTLGGPDIGASHRNFRQLVERLTGKPIKMVPRGHIDDRAGRVPYDPKTNEPLGVYIADDLDPGKSRTRHIIDHEASHLLALITGRKPMPPEVLKEAEFVYSTLATGKENLPKLTLPTGRDYGAPEAEDELMAEVTRAALSDPNYMKTVAPKTYDWLADLFANYGIRLNGLGGATVAALWGMGQEDESLAAETAPEEGTEASQNGTNGRIEVAKALYRHGLHARVPKDKNLGDLTRALINLDAGQKSRFYGGPR